MVSGETERLGPALRVSCSHRPAFADHRGQKSAVNRWWRHADRRRRVKACGIERFPRRSILREETDDGVLRQRHVSSFCAQFVDQGERIALGGHLLRDLEDGLHSLLLGVQAVDPGGQRGTDEMQMLAIDIRMLKRSARRPRLRIEHRIERRTDHIRRAGLRQNVNHSALMRERARFTLVVRRGVEDHRRRRKSGNPAHAAHERVAVDRRHQNVADDDVRADLRQRVERFVAVRGFDNLVALCSKDSRQEVPVERSILDDQNGGHDL